MIDLMNRNVQTNVAFADTVISAFSKPSSGTWTCCWYMEAAMKTMY